MEINNQAYTQAEFSENERIFRYGEARLPIVICVDTSKSMNIVINDESELIYTSGQKDEDGNTVFDVEAKPGYTIVKRMDELKKVFNNMLEKMKKNNVISRSASICIITFDKFSQCYYEFTDLERIPSDCIEDIMTAKNGDETNASKGIDMALERLDRFQSKNQEAGNDSYRPVLIFMSDGKPTDKRAADLAQEKVRKRSEDRNLNVIPVAIGNNINESWLKGLSRESRAYHMNKDSEFEEVFAEISRRIQKATVVIPMDEDEENMANDVDENIASTNYGHWADSDMLTSFMKSQQDTYQRDLNVLEEFLNS